MVLNDASYYPPNHRAGEFVDCSDNDVEWRMCGGDGWPLHASSVVVVADSHHSDRLHLRRYHLPGGESRRAAGVRRSGDVRLAAAAVAHQGGLLLRVQFHGDEDVAVARRCAGAAGDSGVVDNQLQVSVCVGKYCRNICVIDAW